MVELTKEEELILERVEKEMPKGPALRKLRALLEESKRKIKTIPAKKRYLKFIGDEIERTEYLRKDAIQRGRTAYEKFKKTRDVKYYEEARSHWGLAGWYTILIKYCWNILKKYWLDELAREEGYEFIDIDADTGRNIYYGVVEKRYFEIENGRITHTSDELELVETVSVETGGHEDIEVEITSRTRIRNFGRKHYEEFQKIVQTQLNTFFKGLKGFGQIRSDALKIGVETRIRPRTDSKYPFADVLVEKVRERERRYPTYEQEPPVGTPGKVSAYVINLKEPAEPEKKMVKAPIKKTDEEVEPEEILKKRRKELGEVV